MCAMQADSLRKEHWPSLLSNALQDATASAVAATGKGCKWNQDIPALLRVAGLQAQRMQPSLGGLITLVVASKADSNDRTA